jgi:hypothetical protein
MINSTSMKNDSMHDSLKHVPTVKCQAHLDCVQRKIIMIAYNKKSNNIADIMTKQLKSAGHPSQYTQQTTLGDSRRYSLLYSQPCENIEQDPHLSLN